MINHSVAPEEQNLPAARAPGEVVVITGWAVVRVPRPTCQRPPPQGEMTCALAVPPAASASVRPLVSGAHR